MRALQRHSAMHRSRRPAVTGSDRHAVVEALFASHYDAVMRYARRRTDQLADAEDIVAETFAVAWRRLGDIPAPDERLFWLYGIARRVLANQRRGSLRRLRLRVKLRAAPPPAEQAGAALPDVLTAMRRLGPVDQEILRLVAWEGLSHQEIGVVLGITSNAAAIRLHRARARLGHELSGSLSGQTKGFRPIRTLAGLKGSVSRRSQREEVQ